MAYRTAISVESSGSAQEGSVKFGRKMNDRRIGARLVGMDGSIPAQYHKQDMIFRGARILRVAKAGDEDVRSMTLRRAG